MAVGEPHQNTPDAAELRVPEAAEKVAATYIDCDKTYFAGPAPLTYTGPFAKS